MAVDPHRGGSISLRPHTRLKPWMGHPRPVWQVLWYYKATTYECFLSPRRVCDGDHDRWRVLCGPSADSAVVPIRGPPPVSLALAVPEEPNGRPHLRHRGQGGRNSPL